MEDTHEMMTLAPLGIGDVNSHEKGSGARFNAGKPKLELIPIRAIADHWAEMHPDQHEKCLKALYHLADFQEGGNKGCLIQAMALVGGTWAECAEVFDYGRKKYAEWNWAKGMSWSIPLACAVRHLFYGLMCGEEFDGESKLPHRSHFDCNMVMLMTYIENFKQGDNRPKECFQ